MWMGGVCAGPPPICVTVWDEKEIWAQYRISRGTISPSVGKSFSKLCLWANQSHHFGHIYNLWVRDWDGFFHVFIILPPWLPGRGEMEMQGLPTIQPDAHQPMLHHCLSDKDKYKTTMQPAPHQPTLHHYLSDKDKYEDKDNHSARCTPTNITSLSVKQRQIQRQRQRQPCSQLHTNWHYIIVCQTKTNTQTKTKIPTLSDAHQLMSHHCLSDKDKDKDNLTASCTSTDAASLFVSTIPVICHFFACHQILRPGNSTPKCGNVYTTFKKSTPPLVVTVVINISYGLSSQLISLPFVSSVTSMVALAYCCLTICCQCLFFVASWF